MKHIFYIFKVEYMYTKILINAKASSDIAERSD